MKKITWLLIAIMVMMTFAGCGKNAAGEMTLGDYSKLSVAVADDAVTDTEVREQIDKLVQGQMVYKIISGRPAQDGDTVNIGFIGRLEDGPLEGGNSDSYDLELGSGNFIPGFEAGLIGANAGEVRELQLTFPEDYHDAEKAGKPVTFTVTVHEIKQKVAPELTDEWAEAYSGGDAKTVAELQERIREKLETRNGKNNLADAKEELLTKVTEASEVSVTETEIEEQFAKISNAYAQYADAYNISTEAFYEAAGIDEKQLKEKAEQSVRQQKVVDAIFAKEGMKITPKDEEKFAGLWEMSAEELKAQLGDADFAANVKADMVSDFLYEKAEKTAK